MKKLIAIMLVIAALCALTVSALAVSTPEPETAPAAETAEDAGTAKSGRTRADKAADAEETVEIAALSEADALAAALKDAGEAEADVEVTGTRLSQKTTENDETIPVYSIRFTTETTSWKYYVDGNTGAIIYKSVEFQNPDIVLKSHARGDKAADAGKASGEMDQRAGTASGEMDDGSLSARTGKTGGHKGASQEPDISEALTESVAA